MHALGRAGTTHTQGADLKATIMRIEYFLDGRRLDIRAGTGEGTRSAEGARWHPVRGWPVAIGHTSPRAYLSGSEALNLPTDLNDRDRGDWNENSSWWTQSYVAPHGRPHTAELWGPDTRRPAAPGTPRLRDAREALARVEHPDAKAQAPIYATTIVQAVIDMAWRALTQGGEPPSRRETTRWMSDEGEAETIEIAREVAKEIRDARLRERWLAWVETALEQEDPFYGTATSPRRSPDATTRGTIRYTVVPPQ